ncbi:MAG: anti-sigma factor [Thermomicrobiales bacterium]|nr:anti-sigma factor [Thermomicrobiales bacterium]
MNRQTNSALIVAVDLPEPKPGEHYVAWMRFPNGSDYARGGELRVDPDGGRATLVIDPFGWVASYEAVVVTVEADTESGDPTGPSLLTATISAQ